MSRKRRGGVGSALAVVGRPADPRQDGGSHQVEPGGRVEGAGVVGGRHEVRRAHGELRAEPGGDQGAAHDHGDRAARPRSLDVLGRCEPVLHDHRVVGPEQEGGGAEQPVAPGRDGVTGQHATGPRLQGAADEDGTPAEAVNQDAGRHDARGDSGDEQRNGQRRERRRRREVRADDSAEQHEQEAARHAERLGRRQHPHRPHGAHPTQPRRTCPV